MKTSHLAPILIGLATGGEHAVQKAPFQTTLSINGTFSPRDFHVIKITPQEWSSYEIISTVSHGQSVKKGEPLIITAREDYDEKITATKKDSQTRKLALARAEHELSDLELTTPRRIEATRITYLNAKEELDYFSVTGRELEEKQARERLENAELSLAYHQEELKQLLKMYEEDGVTEDTEEIILKRQRISVKRAKAALERAQHACTWALQKTIPRKAIDLKNKFDDALLKYETAKENLPRILEEKRIAVAQKIVADTSADKKFVSLQDDASFFEILSPANGTVYLGGIKEGQWNPGNAADFIKKEGKLPTDTALVTVIDGRTNYVLNTNVGQEERLTLTQGNKATVKVSGLSNQEFPAELSHLSLFPNPGGNYPVTFSVTLPKSSPIATGMSGKIMVTTYQNEAALSVPSSAISTIKGKSVVKVKLADGNHEVREVTTGRSSKGKTEILSGIEVDQIVIVPDPK